MFLIGETNLVDKNLVETNSLLRRGNEKKVEVISSFGVKILIFCILARSFGVVVVCSRQNTAGSSH